MNIENTQHFLQINDVIDDIESTVENNRGCIGMSTNEKEITQASIDEISSEIYQTIGSSSLQEIATASIQEISIAIDEEVSSPSIQKVTPAICTEETCSREARRQQALEDYSKTYREVSGEEYCEAREEEFDEIQISNEKAVKLVETLHKIKSLYYRIKFRLLRLIEAIYGADELF